MTPSSSIMFIGTCIVRFAICSDWRRLSSASNFLTATCPFFKAGISLNVFPIQFFGNSHSMLHSGFGQSSGALQSHLHFGVSQTFSHGCPPLLHCKLHWGLSHCVLQSGQFFEGQSV